MGLRDCIKECGYADEWPKAAEKFADYWGGSETWSTMPDERKATFIKEMRASHGTGILFITHDLRVAAQVCDRVAVMQHGEVVESGATGVLFSSPKHDYTKALLSAVPGKAWQQAGSKLAP